MDFVKKISFVVRDLSLGNKMHLSFRLSDEKVRYFESPHPYL